VTTRPRFSSHFAFSCLLDATRKPTDNFSTFVEDFFRAGFLSFALLLERLPGFPMSTMPNSKNYSVKSHQMAHLLRWHEFSQRVLAKLRGSQISARRDSI